jgi:two-component system nitrate/nitrite response regulator NarL
MQNEIHTMIIGPISLLREGIEFTVCRSRFKVTAAAPNISAIMPDVWERHNAPSIALLLGTDLTITELQDSVRSLRAQRASECIVVIYEGFDNAEVVLQAGASAVLPATISPDVLVMSLNLLMAKEVAMVRLKDCSVGEGATDGRPQHLKGNERKSVRPSNLTRREMEVIRAVAMGESNKHIAARLAMREPTVKSHMRLIMRKIGSRNRTQAATWAVSNGLAERQEEFAIASMASLRKGDRGHEIRF